MGLFSKILGGAGIIGDIAGGLIGAHAAKKASKYQAKKIGEAIDYSKGQFNQTQHSFDPYTSAGANAVGRLDAYSRGDGSSFRTDPGYNFTRTEGQRDIGNSFAAKGGAFGGNALRALTQFNQGLANQQVGNWWNRQMGLAGMGEHATTALGGLRADNASQVGNLTVGQGDARASGIVGAANSLSAGLSGAADTYNYFNSKPAWMGGGSSGSKIYNGWS